MTTNPVKAAQHLRHFTTVRSPFYPDLYGHYEAVFDRWVEKKKKSGGEEEETEEDE